MAGSTAQIGGAVGSLSGGQEFVMVLHHAHVAASYFAGRDLRAAGPIIGGWHSLLGNL